jgi:hypothetical protein
MLPLRTLVPPARPRRILPLPPSLLQAILRRAALSQLS